MWALHSVSEFCWKQKKVYVYLCGYECNLVTVVKKRLEISVEIVPLIYTHLSSHERGVAAQAEKLDLPSPAESCSDGSAQNSRGSLDRIPWLTLPCASIPVSGWRWPSAYGYVTVVTQTGNRESQEQHHWRIMSSRPVMALHIYSRSLFSQHSLLQDLEMPRSTIRILLVGAVYDSLILKAPFRSLCRVQEHLIYKQKRSDCVSFVWVINISQVLWGSGLPAVCSFLKGTLLNYKCACTKRAGFCCKLG